MCYGCVTKGETYEKLERVEYQSRVSGIENGNHVSSDTPVDIVSNYCST